MAINKASGTWLTRPAALPVCPAWLSLNFDRTRALGAHCPLYFTAGRSGPKRAQTWARRGFRGPSVQGCVQGRVCVREVLAELTQQAGEDWLAHLGWALPQDVARTLVSPKFVY